MDVVLILADRIVDLVKSAAVTKLQAQSALSAAGSAIWAIDEIPALSEAETEALRA